MDTVSKRGPLGYRLTSAFVGCCRDSIKRMVFTASLASKLSGRREIGQETLKKLNSIMQLSSTESDMLFPALVADVIWRGKTSIEICGTEITSRHMSEEEIKDAVAHILQHTGNWLRYRNDQMISDARNVLLNRELVL